MIHYACVYMVSTNFYIRLDFLSHIHTYTADRNTSTYKRETFVKLFM